jgi:hypothetical protein
MRMRAAEMSTERAFGTNLDFIVLMIRIHGKSTFF